MTAMVFSFRNSIMFSFSVISAALKKNVFKVSVTDVNGALSSCFSSPLSTIFNLYSLIWPGGHLFPVSLLNFIGWDMKKRSFKFYFYQLKTSFLHVPLDSDKTQGRKQFHCIVVLAPRQGGMAGKKQSMACRQEAERLPFSNFFPSCLQAY